MTYNIRLQNIDGLFSNGDVSSLFTPKTTVESISSLKRFGCKLTTSVSFARYTTGMYGKRCALKPIGLCTYLL